MKTSANSSIPLAANDRMFFKHIPPQLKQVSKTPEGVEKISEVSRKKIRIFLVDDDPLFLKGLELSISAANGSAVINTFQTGEECLEQMKLKPSVVILDYFLNSKNTSASDGLDVLKKIKQLYPKTKVIMLSSQDSLNIAIDCIENGAYDYISKNHSSFVRINNIIKNIAGDVEVGSGFLAAVELIIIVIVFAVIVGFIMSQ
jgi:CheY-like chemotaxis protein